MKKGSDEMNTETVVINGRLIARTLLHELKKEILEFQEQGIVPNLTVIILGNDPSAMAYVRMIEKNGKAVHLDLTIKQLPIETSEEELVAEIEALNVDPKVHGILIQMPLPKQIRENVILKTIDYRKDVDGFNPLNTGRLVVGADTYLPCTPGGIMHILEYHDIDLSGKNAVVIGRSNIVGKPIAMLLLEKNATVTICHSRTEDLKSHTKNADILVAAVGRPKFITGDMIKEGAVVIDVGINDVEGKIVGDVDFESTEPVAGYITPVPGGVGSTTISILIQNTLKSVKRAIKRAQQV